MQRDRINDVADVFLTALEALTTTMNTEGSAVQFWRATRHRTRFVFGVRACARVQLLPTAVMHSIENSYTYLIELQDQNNMTTIWTWYSN
jgi:hypothetical protein